MSDMLLLYWMVAVAVLGLVAVSVVIEGGLERIWPS